MFVAQLAAFLTAHHHALGLVTHMFPGKSFDPAYRWAAIHGFVFQR
jgi:hypothetical protein